MKQLGVFDEKIIKFWEEFVAMFKSKEGGLMICHQCGGEYEEKIIDFEVKVDCLKQIVPDVRALVCNKCGDQILEANQSKKVGKFITDHRRQFELWRIEKMFNKTLRVFGFSGDSDDMRFWVQFWEQFVKNLLEDDSEF